MDAVQRCQVSRQRRNQRGAALAARGRGPRRCPLAIRLRSILWRAPAFTGWHLHTMTAIRQRL